jgi:hypothetical protein
MAGKMSLPKLIKIALDETGCSFSARRSCWVSSSAASFEDGFETLPTYARYLDGIALLLMIITVAFLITPESSHQIVEVGADTGRFHDLYRVWQVSHWCRSRSVWG